MPIREYVCSEGHVTEKLLFVEPPVEKPCPECERLNREEPMFHPTIATATLAVSKVWSPSSDYQKAEARAKYKAGAGDAR